MIDIFPNMSVRKRKKIIVQEELERHILHGLACEWEAALWVLRPSHKKLMRKPLFSLTGMKKKLGYWSGERREICLSRNLVLDHPWDAVREVFLHEIAHQFAEEVLCANHESPHGEKFQRACHLLRANPKASGNYMPLDERILHESSNSKDKIMIRVRKLLALAESQNQHEAESAMAKAHELITKYNLDFLACDKNRDFVSVFVGKPALRHPREDYRLARLLQDFYFVHGIWVPTYVLDKEKMGRVLEISGTAQNTKLAAYVHDFVVHFIHSQWREYNRDRTLNRYRKTDFAVGIMEGFCSKLKSKNHKKKKTKVERSLIKIGDPLLQEYVAYKYPYTVKSRTRVSSQDVSVLKDGMSVGKKLVISKAITERRKDRGLLIGSRKPSVAKVEDAADPRHLRVKL